MGKAALLCRMLSTCRVREVSPRQRVSGLENIRLQRKIQEEDSIQNTGVEFQTLIVFIPNNIIPKASTQKVTPNFLTLNFFSSLNDEY